MNESRRIEDLDIFYLMTIGTWKSSIENKKKNIDNSRISTNEKESIGVLNNMTVGRTISKIEKFDYSLQGCIGQ